MVHASPQPSTTVAKHPPESPDSGSALLMEWGRLALAADDARQRLHATQVRGDRCAAAQAEWGHEDAITALHRWKEQTAADFLVGLKMAMEIQPGRVAEVLDQWYRQELDVTQAAVVQAEQDIEELEEVVASLIAGKGAAK